MTNEEMHVLEYFIQQVYCAPHTAVGCEGTEVKTTTCVQGPQSTLRETGL